MTTTAAAWRHIWLDGDACMGHEGKFLCGCTTPTPDPASPCGYRWSDDMECQMRRGASAHDEPEGHHPHQPTRCERCGHALEAVRAEQIEEKP